MKRKKLILLSALNYLLSLLDESEKLFWEEFNQKKQLQATDSRREINQKIIAACDRIDEVCDEKPYADNIV